MGESLLVAGNFFAFSQGWTAPWGLGPTNIAVNPTFGGPLLDAVQADNGILRERTHDCPLPSGIRPFPSEQVSLLIPAEMDGELRLVEERFRGEPAEANILAFLAVLDRHALRVNDLRDRMTANCGWMYGPDPFRQHDAGFLASLNGFRHEAALQFAGFENSYLSPLDETLRARLFRMIRGSGDDIRRSINESFAHQLLGDQVRPVAYLLTALDELDRRENRSGEASPPLLLERITVLHRLISLSQTRNPEDAGRLRRAADDIRRLGTTHPDYAVLLSSENLKLLRVHEEREVQADAHAGRIEEDAIADEHSRRVGGVLEETIRNAEEGLADIHDPVVRDLLRRDLADAASAMIELRYSTALYQYVQEESEEDESAFRPPDTPSRLSAASAARDMADLDRLRAPLGPELFSEMRARTLLARAYHSFRTGVMEDADDGRAGALTDLETILRDHPDTGAARFIRTQGNWPNVHGIVRDDGSLTPDLHDPDFGAALLTLAGLLTENEGRALIGCSVGAVLAAGASLVFGEKISGAALITGCMAGTLIERADHVFNHLNRLEQAYRSGVSNVTAEEALRSVGEFVLTTFSMFAGHRLGLAMARGVGTTGRFIGSELANYMTRAGFTPGPWTRGIASLALTETGHVAQALTLHETMIAGQQIAHPDADIPFTLEGGFGTWLFSRFLGPLVRMNPAEAFLPSRIAGGAAGNVFNHAFSMATLEAGREIILGEDMSRYGDRLAQGFFYMAPFLGMMSRPGPGTPPPPSSGGTPAPRGPAPVSYSALEPGAVVRIPIADIVPTQGKVFANAVDNYVTNASRGNVPEIRVLEGVPYVVDGHHRIMAALARGETYIEVRNYNPATDPDAGMTPMLRERATTWDRIVIQIPAPKPGASQSYPWLN